MLYFRILLDLLLLDKLARRCEKIVPPECTAAHVCNSLPRLECFVFSSVLFAILNDHRRERNVAEQTEC